MPYQVSWYIPERVYRIKIWGDLTLEELPDLVKTSSDHVQDKTLPVHSITDLLEMTSSPMNITQVTDILRKYYRKPPNDGWVVVIRPTNLMINFVVSIMGQLFGYRFRIFDNFAEGVAFLQEIDSTLSALNGNQTHRVLGDTEDAV